jgi:hypothetical protein
VAALAFTAAPAGAMSPSDTDARTAMPYHGSYLGGDSHHRTIRFEFHHNAMSQFMVNHTVIGGAHVGHDAWHETCHNGYCTSGQWVDDVTVRGTWRHGSGHAIHWEARLYAH